jgi:hypothetical protein
VSSDGCTFMPLKLFIKIPNTFERWEFSIAAESFELIPNTCCIRERAEKSLPLCCRIATPATWHLFSAKPLQRQVGPENCNREIEACAELFQMQLRIARGGPLILLMPRERRSSPDCFSLNVFAWLKVSLVPHLVGRIVAPPCASRSRYRRAYLIPRQRAKASRRERALSE